MVHKKKNKAFILGIKKQFIMKFSRDNMTFSVKNLSV